jgi:ketosteroid isomerase-like protein
MDPDLERRIRAGYAAFGSGDFHAALALFTPDARYVNPPDAIEAGTREGHDGLRTAFETLHDQFAYGALVIDELREGPGCVLVTGLMRGRGRASGAPIELALNHVLRVRDGRAHAVEWYFEHDEALRAAGLG